jgi:O-antigen ligase
LIVGLVYHKRIETIFWKQKDFSVNEASSGRLSVWKHNIRVFKRSTIEKKLIGHGIGSETELSAGANENKIISSHNDYVSLLMTLGIVGVFLYTMIFVSIYFDIFRSKLPEKNKVVYSSMVLVVAIMSFLSNGYLFRLDVSQSFWLLIGIFYIQEEHNINPQTIDVSCQNLKTKRGVLA